MTTSQLQKMTDEELRDYALELGETCENEPLAEWEEIESILRSRK
jgi:hypothetical protein